jgi:hypothetical protein
MASHQLEASIKCSLEVSVRTFLNLNEQFFPRTKFFLAILSWCTAFGIGQVLEAEIFLPVILYDLNDPQQVDKLVEVKLTRDIGNK